eukprot:scaffold17669_cov88-Skeletonema_marinoi.AAC.4
MKNTSTRHERGGSAQQEECDKKEVQILYKHSADGCTIMPRPRMEEFASSMAQRSINTPVMDAQTLLRREECAQDRCKGQTMQH